MRPCVRVRVRACVRVCVRVCVRACVCVHAATFRFLTYSLCCFGDFGCGGVFVFVWCVRACVCVCVGWYAAT